MGTSTNATICYGVDFGDQLPWAENEGFCDELEDKDIDRYEYEEALDHFLGPDHGLEIVVHCSSECREYILALKDVGHVASRGYPVEFEPAEMWKEVLRREGARESLLRAMKKFGCDDNPSCILCSYWS